MTIERHGRAVAVMPSADQLPECDALRLARLRGGVQVGWDDLEAGRVVSGETAFAAARARLDE